MEEAKQTYTIYFGDIELPMIKDAYNLQETFLEVMLPTEGMSIDYIDSIVSNRNNLKLIRIYDEFDRLVVRLENRYTEYDYVTKQLKYQISMYNERGEREPQYIPVIKVRVNTPSADSRVDRLQATMEYMAIMADIDINEE